MQFQVVSIKQIFLSVALCLTCITGDYLNVLCPNKPTAIALLDNFTHGLVGLLAACIIASEFYQKLAATEAILLILICGIVASAIDVDHFIVAKSFRLSDATNLSSRPFLHCSNIPFVLFLCLIVAKYFKSFRLNIWICVFLCAFITHHIRDATRRGFWFQPYGHTPPIPYLMYIVLTVLTPFLLIYLLNLCLPSDDVHRIKYTYLNV